MQSHRNSLIEQGCNIGSGFFVAIAVQTLIINPLWGYHTSTTQDLTTVLIFTVASFLRSYAWRRAFNQLDYKNKKKRSDESTNRNHGPCP